MLTLTKETVHQEVELSTKPVVIDVFATWCGPCMRMKPIFEQLEKEYGDTYKFLSLNIDEERELAVTYSITSVPSFIFIKDGVIKGKITGSMPKDDLLERIKEYLN
jgi:Thioredoxin domain-containing protein